MAKWAFCHPSVKVSQSETHCYKWAKHFGGYSNPFVTKLHRMVVISSSVTPHACCFKTLKTLPFLSMPLLFPTHSLPRTFLEVCVCPHVCPWLISMLNTGSDSSTLTDTAGNASWTRASSSQCLLAHYLLCHLYSGCSASLSDCALVPFLVAGTACILSAEPHRPNQTHWVL